MQYNTTRCIDENQDNETLKDMTMILFNEII